MEYLLFWWNGSASLATQRFLRCQNSTNIRWPMPGAFGILFYIHSSDFGTANYIYNNPLGDYLVGVKLVWNWWVSVRVKVSRGSAPFSFNGNRLWRDLHWQPRLTPKKPSPALETLQLRANRTQLTAGVTSLAFSHSPVGHIYRDVWWGGGGGGKRPYKRKN